MLQPGFRLRQTYWAEQVLQPARPSDFHTAIFKAQSHHTIMRAAVLGLPSLFDKQVQTQRRNGRENFSTHLHYHLPASTTVLLSPRRSQNYGALLDCWIREERVSNPAKKGRENELLYLSRENPRSYSSWVCEESSNPAKKGRENEFITLVAAD